MWYISLLLELLWYRSNLPSIQSAIDPICQNIISDFHLHCDFSSFNQNLNQVNCTICISANPSLSSYCTMRWRKEVCPIRYVPRPTPTNVWKAPNAPQDVVMLMPASWPRPARPLPALRPIPHAFLRQRVWRYIVCCHQCFFFFFLFFSQSWLNPPEDCESGGSGMQCCSGYCAATKCRPTDPKWPNCKEDLGVCESDSECCYNNKCVEGLCRRGWKLQG